MRKTINREHRIELFTLNSPRFWSQRRCVELWGYGITRITLRQGEACISDFGMGQAMEDVDTASSSRHSIRLGARWVPLELIADSPPTKESDVYTFGMVVLELLTGEPPFSEYRSEVAVLRALVNGTQPKRPTESTVWLTDELWALVQRCWSKGPESRPTMEVVVVDLEKMQPSHNF